MSSASIDKIENRILNKRARDYPGEFPIYFYNVLNIPSIFINLYHMSFFSIIITNRY